jgi:hypothetical protein
MRWSLSRRRAWHRVGRHDAIGNRRAVNPERRVDRSLELAELFRDFVKM